MASLSRRHLLSTHALRNENRGLQLDVPCVTLLADNAVAKNIFVEAMTDVAFPAIDSVQDVYRVVEYTCTSSEEPWTCDISIRRSSDAPSTPVTSGIKDKSTATDILLKACYAAVFPQESLTNVMKMDLEVLQTTLESNKKVLPSPGDNVLCVSVSGPKLPNLEFVDVRGDSYPVDNLQSSGKARARYLTKHTFFVVILPAKETTNTSEKALEFARQNDPKGERTLVIITLPPVLKTDEAHTRYIEKVNASKLSLGPRNFCIKLPPKSGWAAGTTWTKIRAEELSFFETDVHWAACRLKVHLGMDNALSAIIDASSKFVQSKVKALIEEFKVAVTSCHQEKNNLPPPMQGPALACLLTMLGQFQAEVNKQIASKAVDAGYQQAALSAFELFNTEMMHSAPMFVPTEEFLGDPTGSKMYRTSSSEARKKGKMYMNARDVRAVVNRYNDVSGPFHRVETDEIRAELIHMAQSGWNTLMANCLDSVSVALRGSLLDSNITIFRNYPSFLQDIRDLILELVLTHTTGCATLLDAILDAEDAVFTRDQQGLEAAVSKWHAFYRENHIVADATIVLRPTPPTPRAIASLPSRASSKLPPSRSTTVRSSPHPSDFEPSSDSEPSSSAPSSKSKAASSGRKKAKLEEKAAVPEKDRPNASSPSTTKTADDYKTEILLMAEVRGYLEISSHRVVDMVVMLIRSKLVKAVMNDLQPFLISGLGVGSAPDEDTACSRFLRELEAAQSQRIELEEKEAQLKKLQAALERFVG